MKNTLNPKTLALMNYSKKSFLSIFLSFLILLSSCNSSIKELDNIKNSNKMDLEKTVKTHITNLSELAEILRNEKKNLHEFFGEFAFDF